ncbi:MAG: tocopherol cyclase family protein, partial [Pygmaiobacter sp.]
MDRFEGWYYKMQAPEASLALIFAQHQQGSHKSASLQLTDGTVAASFALSALCARAGAPPVLLFPQGTAGGFGLKLHLETADCSFSCRFHFKNMIVPRSDVMGIFQYVPLLECRHSVFSLRHRVDGVYTLNGQCRQFENAAGYLEGDRGRSFPRRYLWTQCLFGGNLQHSVMLSVADIP